MKKLRNLLRMPFSRRRLLMRAAFFVFWIRIALRLVPHAHLRRVFMWLSRERFPSFRGACVSADQISWAVKTASRYLPGPPTCLPQALAAQLLLKRSGFPVHLRIGVAKDEKGGLLAHAWVETQGRVVVGGGGLERYAPLPGLDALGS